MCGSFNPGWHQYTRTFILCMAVVTIFIYSPSWYFGRECDPAKFVVRRLILNLSTSVHDVWGELVILKITNRRGRELAIGVLLKMRNALTYLSVGVFCWLQYVNIMVCHSPTVLSASILMDNVLFSPSLVLEILVEQYRSILQQSLMFVTYAQATSVVLSHLIPSQCTYKFSKCTDFTIVDSVIRFSECLCWKFLIHL